MFGNEDKTKRLVSLIQEMLCARLKFDVDQPIDENQSQLMAKRNGDAQKAMDLMQKLYDDDKYWAEVMVDTPNTFRYHLRPMMVKLAQRSGKLPQSLYVVTRVKWTSPAKNGGFADIYKGTLGWLPGGRAVAIKRIRWDPSLSDATLRQTEERFKLEILVWTKMRHPNVVPLLGIAKNSHLLSIVLEWYPNGSLANYISDNAAEIDSMQLYAWIKHASEGLAYLHSERIVHGDVQWPNILLHSSGVAQLTDFGLSVLAYEHSHSYNSARDGRERFLAPEQLEPQKYGFSSSRPTFNSDVFSFSFTCTQIFSGTKPFAESEDPKKLILEGQRPARPNRLGSDELMKDDLWNLLCSCWEEIRYGDGSARPDMTDIAARIPSK
ncbi:unnamed protein product [Somion occarium]|uniref:Protein kinase domain-containing protein n=1 Tax=Somion occarium TaxID=3059160 RepID=A0ABP1CGZ2_9APHY